MKKLLLCLAVWLALLAFVACGGEAVVTTNTPADSTSAPADSTPTSSTAALSQGVTKPESTKPSEPATVGNENYTAVLNDAVWEDDDSVNMADFTYVGTGLSAVREFDSACNGYKKTYCKVDENGNEVESTKKDLQTLGLVGAVITKDDTAKVGKLVVKEISIKLMSEWKSVTAKGGYYLLFDFTTNLDTAFTVTVTVKEGGNADSALDQQDGITVSGDNGKYTGIAKCNVPRQENKTYYINICLDDGSKYPVVASIPLTTTELQYEGAYSLVFMGDWQLIKDETYRDRLAWLFYSVYPRLYERWGTGSEAKSVTLLLDSSYDGVAAAGGSQVRISTDYANRKPDDIGFLSHEITHLVAKYPGKVIVGSDGGWWSENFANYGGFRYFHWGTTAQHVQIPDLSNQKVQDWGYQPYGENKAFFAYMDDKYPTTDKNGDGKITSDEYGLIDAINFLIKANTGSAYSDNATNTNSPFNKKVAEVTEGKYLCIEDLRKQFEKDCENKTWDFVGFRDYKDNFLTEGINGLADPEYPMLEAAVPGNKTSPVLASPVLEGDNLALNATAVKYSHATTKQPITYLVDGKLDTYWQGSDIDDFSYQLIQVPQGVVIDLGAEKTFNTYTLVCRGYSLSNKSFNAKEWEILVSSDGKNFTSIDYQNGNKADVVSVNVGDVSARYIEIRFFTTDQNNTDNVRIQEFMLFDQ